MFDTNVAVSTLVFGRRLAWLRQSWAQAQTIPIICRETASELIRVLAYPKFSLSREDREFMLEDYLPFVEIVAIPDPPPVIPAPCRDASDTIFVQLAIVAAADFVVTGDADLTALRESSPVRVITVGELRRILTG